jgi:IS605 OrfB family transposase
MKLTTLQFRIKDSISRKHLERMAGSVNFVWNCCQEISMESIRKNGRFLSGFDLNKQTSGCSKELGILAATIQAIGDEYATKRKRFKRFRLNWRSKKRSLGWIPFKGSIINIDGDCIQYGKHIFKFWQSQPIESKVRCGSFSQDSKGNWFVNLVVEDIKPQLVKNNKSVGIDLGLKTIATLSDGRSLHRENQIKKYAEKLAMAQRAGKKRQVKNIHTKAKNVRKDWAHKETTKLVNEFDTIIIGDVSSQKLAKTRMAKSVLDAGWGQFKSMLEYKSKSLGIDFRVVNESFSTVTCSACFEKSGPSGLSGLRVREWTCSICGVSHLRDVNAAINILRFGHETPIKGISRIYA